MNTLHRILLVVFVCASSLLAQRPASRPGGESPPVQFRFRVETGGIVGSQIEDSSEDLDAWITNTRFDATWRSGRGRLISLGVEHEHRRYGDVGRSLVPGVRDPFRDVHGVGLRARWIEPIDESWSVFTQLGVRGRAEAGADLADGISALGLVAAGYEVSDELRIGFGALVLHRFEEDLLVVPGLTFDWRPAEDWRLVFQGTRLTLTHNVTDDWDAFVETGWNNFRFRLEDGAERGAIIEDTRWPLTLGARYRPNDALSLELRLGTTLYREVDVLDRGGRELRSRDVDPGFEFGVALSYSF